MDAWDVFSYAMWIASALLIIWLLFDFFRVGREHEEWFLLSSREGHDEILDQERKFAEERDKQKQRESRKFTEA